jgi:tetratricopeptide (TPR) repeat protein
MTRSRYPKSVLMRIFLLPIIVLLLAESGAKAAFQDQPAGVRLMQLASPAEAEHYKAQIESGASFADLARMHSLDPTSAAGGYLGSVVIGDLRSEFRNALSGLDRGETSPVVTIDTDYFLFQLVTEAEEDWLALTAEGRRALTQGRSQEAEESFRTAIEVAEALGETGRHLLVDGLRNLSALLQIQGNDPDAQRFYERSMNVYWGEPSEEGYSELGDVLDAFTELVALGGVQNEEFQTELIRYTDAISVASPGEELYWAISDIFDTAGLVNEAELTLAVAVENFLDSTASLRQLADHHVTSGAVRQAIEEFERAIQMAPDQGVDPSLGVVQKSYFYQRIGDAYGSLVQYQDAVEAYGMALDVDPGNPGARFELGLLHYVNNRFEDALFEYNVMLEANPGNADLLYRIAEAQLGAGRFEESVESSRSALRAQPDHRRSRYVLGTSLVRMGRTEEGRAELTRFGQSEAEAGTADRLSHELTTLINGAQAALLNSQGERGMELYREGVEAHPGVPLLRLNLANTQSRLGQHETALATLEAIVDLDLSDNALLHKALAREYEFQRDSQASQRHRTIYLQRLDAWLRSGLETRRSGVRP